MKTSTGYRIKVGACVAFAAVALLVTGAMAFGASAVTVPVPVLAGLGVGAEARADHALRAGESVENTISANAKALNAAPMNAAAWLRIAYIRSANGAPLDKGAIEAIEKSYSVAPFGPDVTSWRLQFLYGRWAQLTPELRNEAMAEHLESGRQISLTSAVPADQGGALAAALMNRAARASRAEQLAQRAKDVAEK